MIHGCVRKTITARVKNLRSFKNSDIWPKCYSVRCHISWLICGRQIDRNTSDFWPKCVNFDLKLETHFCFYRNRDFLTSDPSPCLAQTLDPSPWSQSTAPSPPPSPWAALGPAGQTAANSGTSNCGPGGSIKPPHLQAEWTALQRSVWTAELPSCLSVLAPPPPSTN